MIYLSIPSELILSQAYLPDTIQINQNNQDMLCLSFNVMINQMILDSYICFFFIGCNSSKKNRLILFL